MTGPRSLRSDVIIPIDDVYSAFFSNEILDVGHFEEEDAGDTEKAVYSAFTTRKEEVISEILATLSTRMPRHTRTVRTRCRPI